MKDERINYKLFSIILFILFSCHTTKPDIFSLDQENIKLRFFPNNKFEYSYYKMGGMSFENSVRNYCNGEYKEVSKNKYDLFPNKFNPDSIETQIKLSEISNGRPLHLIFTTEIRDDKKNEYKILVYYNSGIFQVNGTSLDTILSNSIGPKIRIEILLPEFYAKGHPSAIFKKLSTDFINIDSAEMVKIHSPITWEYFYYLDPGNIKIEDKSNYYFVNGKKIKKE